MTVAELERERVTESAALTANSNARPPWVEALVRDPIHAWVASEWDRAAANPGCRFDSEAAEKAVGFFPTYLCFTKGRWAGRRFVLEDWQAAVVRMLFGWKRKDGKRVFRRALIWVGRGNGKSEFAAGLMLLAFLFDAELNGEGYVIARDKKQAGIVFGRTTRMVQLSPWLPKYLDTFKTSIYCPETGSAIQSLSGNAEGKHGLACSVLVGDEMHEWPNGDLYEFVNQSEIKREQPLEILISTAGQAQRGYGWVLWEESLKIRSGSFHNPQTLVVIYAAELTDDWKSPDTWRKANPSLGSTISVEDVKEHFSRALESPRLETNFKRYYLNIWVGQDTRWLELDRYREGSGRPSILPDARWRRFWDELKGRECLGALDLSSTSDLTCLLWLFPPDDLQKGKWIALPKLWVPSDNIERRSRRDRVPYDVWHKCGAIEPTEGNVVDYEPVIAAVHAGMAQFKVKQVGFDPYNATHAVNTLTGEGAPMIKIEQRMRNLSAASKQLEMLVQSGRIDGGGHPVLDWMISNVAKKEDHLGNIMPDKAKSSEKIDGVACLVMDLALAGAGEKPEPSYQMIIV